MVVLLLILFPLLYLFNSYLALAALLAAIVAKYFEGTRPRKRPVLPKRTESVYKAGYED